MQFFRSRFHLSAAAAAQTVLTTLDGGRVDLDSQKGKVVVLAVGAAWLPLSAKQAEYINVLAKKYAGKDVVFTLSRLIRSNVKSKNFMSPEDIRKFAGTNKIGVTVLRDSDGAVTLKKYDIDQVPSFVILNKSGVRVGEPASAASPRTLNSI